MSQSIMRERVDECHVNKLAAGCTAIAQYSLVLKKSVWCLANKLHTEASNGEMAERPKAAVLKTVEGQPSLGSNPSLSAKQHTKR